MAAFLHPRLKKVVGSLLVFDPYSAEVSARESKLVLIEKL